MAPLGASVSDDSDPAPVEPTYGWGSYRCVRCGEATDRGWRVEAGMVCPACVEW